MKKFLKLTAFFAIAALVIAGCDKVDDLPFYNNGNAPALSTSSSSVAPTVADSSKAVVTFNWTPANYATDSSTVKYTLQIDSAGKNFVKPYWSKTVTGGKSISLTGAEITNLLIAQGFLYNKLYDLDVRVISSYANNNEPYTSNVVRIKASAYVTPPKVAPPASKRLFLVGDASQGGWNNPVPVPSQEFGTIDSVTYVGVFDMNAGKEFLVLPVNGDWTNKYSLVDNSVAGVQTGGAFGYNNPQNFKGPANSGWYKVTLDFQRGTYKIEPYVGAQIPANLFMVGDATPGGWNNPVPTPSQQYTRKNSVQYELTLNSVNAGKEFLLLPVNGDWGNKYSVINGATGTNPTATGGYFGYNHPNNFPGPTATGNYKFELNFGVQQKNAAGADVANTAWYKVTKL